MPTAKLPSGVELAYSDSGVPAAAPYDTIVFCHGVGYNKEIFGPLFDVRAPALRLIAYNQRGYAGSTALGEREAKLLPEDAEAQALSYVYDLIGFLKFVDSLGVPRKPILVGWSKGTTLLIGLAAKDYLPERDRAEALSLVSALILYEPPGNAFALPPTKDYTDAMASALASSDERVVSDRFAAWISGFYEPGSDSPFQYSADLLPAELISRASEPHMVRHGFFWRHSTNPARQAALTASVFEAASAVPVAVCRNGQTAGYLVAAANEADRLGGVVRLLDSTGNHLAFAHTPKEWLAQVCDLAGELLGRPVGK